MKILNGIVNAVLCREKVGNGHKIFAEFKIGSAEHIALPFSAEIANLADAPLPVHLRFGKHAVGRKAETVFFFLPCRAAHAHAEGILCLVKFRRENRFIDILQGIIAKRVVLMRQKAVHRGMGGQRRNVNRSAGVVDKAQRYRSPFFIDHRGEAAAGNFMHSLFRHRFLSCFCLFAFYCFARPASSRQNASFTPTAAAAPQRTIGVLR